MLRKFLPTIVLSFFVSILFTPVNVLAYQPESVSDSVIEKPAFSLTATSEIVVVGGEALGFVAISTGGAATYTISGTPTGMVFDTSTGQLSGNPSVVKSATTYTVTASNVSGRATQQFRLTVNPAAPAFELSVASVTVAVGEAAGFTVNSTGGHISRFSITPRVPSGMVFNSRTGTLSGKPRFVQSATTYTVTGVGLGGSSTQQFELTVNVRAPGFSLSRYSQTVVKGSAAGFTVKSTGGLITSFSISPAAPTGMSFNTSTGLLSGSPTSAQSATTYTVTATNASGSASQQFVLTVTASFPAFTLSSSSQTVTQSSGAGFTVNSTGGLITSFSISPAAPTDMSFNTSTGQLSGNPSVVKSATTYTVTASNVSGRATRQFRLTVNPATPAFVLSRSSHNAAAGFASGFTVVSTGGHISRFSITPRVPSGMLFSSRTGTLSGKPKALQPKTAYTVTATNVSGSVSQTFELTVTRTGDEPGFVLSISSQSIIVGSTAGFTVNSTGGLITSFSISPAAPTGMSFNTSTGQLSGSPSTIKSATTYTVTGSNSFASVVRTYVLTVKAKAPAFALSLSSQTVYQGDSAGFTVNPTGGAATYSISATPTGMTFNTSTGQLSGKPTQAKASTRYTVTASNSTGSATRTFDLLVRNCASGGTCSLGNTGPGGGVVVYVNSAGFNCLANTTGTCKYMEAFNPNLRLKWSGNTTQSVAGTSNAIGAGYKNNQLAIIQSNTTNTAVREAWYFARNGKSDWNLPSRYELRQVWNAFGYQNSWTSNQHSTAGQAIMSNGKTTEQGYSKSNTPAVYYVRCFS